jgi:hypothetical protein
MFTPEDAEKLIDEVSKKPSEHVVRYSKEIDDELRRSALEKKKSAVVFVGRHRRGDEDDVAITEVMRTYTAAGWAVERRSTRRHVLGEYLILFKPGEAPPSLPDPDEDDLASMTGDDWSSMIDD